MAYNPRRDPNSEDSKALVRFLAPTPIIKNEYYMEWWRIGDQATDINTGMFRSSYIKNFVKMFMGFRRYTIVYLERCHDRKVLWNRRLGGCN